MARKTITVTLRLPEDLVDELDDLVRRIGDSPDHRAIRPSRTTAAILALKSGIQAVRSDLSRAR